MTEETYWDYGDGEVIESDYMEELLSDLRRSVSHLHCEYLWFKRNYGALADYMEDRELDEEYAKMVLTLGEFIHKQWGMEQ